MHRFIWISLFLIALSCSADRDPASLFGPEEQGTIVVDALLIIDQPMPSLFVRQTLSPAVTYTQDAAAIRGADVTITRGSNTFQYTESTTVPGQYDPPANPPLITPNTSYSLLVRVGTEEVRAATTTPERISLNEVIVLDENTLETIQDLVTFKDNPDEVFTAPQNQVVYQDNLLETRFNPVNVQAYQVGIFSLDKDSDFVIEADFLEEEDFEDFERETSSPPLEVADGNLRLPWFAIAFAGRHIIKVYAIDDNWYDFARSSPEQDNGGFGGLAGDNFERPIFQVDGGIGLFGSASVDSLGFVVLPRN